MINKNKKQTLDGRVKTNLNNFKINFKDDTT